MKYKLITTAALAGTLAVVLAGCGAPAAAPGSGADYPKQGETLEIIVAFAPGGAVDTAARLVAPVLEEELGLNVEVINQPGAGGQIGYTVLTSAEPDGYTIGATGSPSVVVSPLDPARQATYTRESFLPLARQVVDPAVIAVKADSPYQTLDDLLEAAKAAPDTITAATSGLQGGEHFALAQIKQKTEAALAPVHFSEGSTAAATAFLGGHVDVLVANVVDMSTLVQEDEARVLGVMSSERSPALPDVPTFAEQGYDVESATVRGYSAPAGLPDDIAKKLEAALKVAINDEEVVAKMADLGLVTDYLSGADYEAYWAEQEATFKAALPLVQEQ